MAEPLRNDEPLSSTRFPESPSSAGNARPGPVPVERRSDLLRADGSVIEPIDAERTLPQHATEQPLGAWPETHTLRSDDTGSTADAVNNVITIVVDRAKQIPGFMSDRVTDLRRKFRVIRGRVESGELQSELRDRASDLGDQASRQARYARSRAEFYARNYPLQFIAGAAAVGFVVGFLLRLGRDE